MEKAIIQMMEIAYNMTIEEMEENFEEAYKSETPSRYLMKEIFQNEINRRNGKRHISLEKVKKIYEDKKAALS